MGAAQKITSLSALDGIRPEGQFLNSETLTLFVQSEGFESVKNRFIGEKIRALREEYKLVHHYWSRHHKTGSSKRLENSVIQWIQSLIKFLGYQNFEQKTYKDPSSGHIIYYLDGAPETSLGIFFALKFINNESSSYQSLEERWPQS
ncbi:MAG: hypothetical protein NZ480_06970, partial [Bdellovibrionaceae bacterium]|nr:hypothetical protein [Pseudobdellovibrionaceae bacterium]MDW8191226.1 hypothetical protein [Pseudobdellovibrionaceae bacterium]